MLIAFCHYSRYLVIQRGKTDQKVYPLSAIKSLQTVIDSIQYSQFNDDTDDDDEDNVLYKLNNHSIHYTNEPHNATDSSCTNSDEC